MATSCIVKCQNYQSRLLFLPLTKEIDIDPETQRFGIKVHNCLGATLRKILHLFGLAQGIIEADFNGRRYYLNRGSLKNWCQRYGVVFTRNDSAKVKINEVLNHLSDEIKDRIKNHEDQKTAFNEKIKEVATARLEQMALEYFNEDGSFKINNTLDELEDVPYNSESTYYHGTNATFAKKIREEGFNIYQTAENGKLYGAGIYITPNYSMAKGYSDKLPNSVLKYKVKEDLRLAKVTLLSSMTLSSLAYRCLSQKRNEIAEDIQEIKEALPNNVYLQELKDYKELIHSLFVREFYLKNDFQGCSMQGLAPFLVIFNPEEDLEELP